MSLFRLLLFALLFYFAYRVVTGLLRGPARKQGKVQGTDKGKPPLDLSDHDVEDADFEDIK